MLVQKYINFKSIIHYQIKAKMLPELYYQKGCFYESIGNVQIKIT